MFMNLNPGMIGIRASLPDALEMAQTYGFPGVDLNITEAAEMVKAASQAVVGGVAASRERYLCRTRPGVEIISSISRN
ncbi:MAG: hypothetical protein QGI34_08635 [Candidatus Latescibacteria bacterium]|nr:hypothetical protein [Candidatus Latescibacterota bacterium]